ncbi:cellulose biosynthesis protein BcsG [Chitinimonas sp.]|uniref:cellulose biosynthesis protein BcsG n=1 Tax=Chitinimonas sp. TaxID=1934313 RepID=UPI0035AE91DE
MTYWNLYFIAKLILYFGGFIGFHVIDNLLFAAVLLFPLKRRSLRIARLMLALPLAVALFYHDSWFPPPSRLLSQASYLQGFSPAYMLELAGRFINVRVVQTLGVALVLWWLARRWLRVSSFVLLAMLAVPLWELRLAPAAPMPATMAAGLAGSQIAAPASQGPASSVELDRSLSSFFSAEQGRSVVFTAPVDAGEPFDIIVLHVCSLSWDDLAFVGSDHHPLLNKFDVVFRNFSSGASYSGPAAIRLLRASCGQRTHTGLYGAIAQPCFLFHGLEQVGFQTQYAMNHDGHFGDFISDVQQRGEMQVPPLAINDTPVYLKAFDDTPIRDDYAVLEKWWKARLASPVQRVGLYYNTISLHDGNHYPGSAPGGSVKIYKPRVEKLLGDVDRLLQLIAASGRKAAVVMIPEHGAALRGDKMQISGLREIPGPRISLVPVGVKLVNGPGSGQPLYVDKPTSYLAMTKLLANFIARNPYGSPAPHLADYVADLPTTEFVADNGDIVVQRFGSRYYLHSKGEDWAEYVQ